MTGTSDPRGGEPVESDPAAATEKERTLHAEHCTPADALVQMARFGGRPAGRRPDADCGETGDEQRPATVPVTEPDADDQADGVLLVVGWGTRHESLRTASVRVGNAMRWEKRCVCQTVAVRAVSV